jgi:hypothetical protein
MGLFGGKKHWTSLPAEDVADALMSMKHKDAIDAMKQIKDGKVPGLSVKDQKRIEKDYKKKTEGERSLGPGAAAAKDFFAGKKGTTVDGPTQRGAAKKNQPLNRDGTPRSTWW